MSIQSINARNQFRGKIKEIILGPVVSGWTWTRRRASSPR